jgi:hypothetical protein
MVFFLQSPWINPEVQGPVGNGTRDRDWGELLQMVLASEQSGGLRQRCQFAFPEGHRPLCIRLPHHVAHRDIPDRPSALDL